MLLPLYVGVPLDPTLPSLEIVKTTSLSLASPIIPAVIDGVALDKP